MYIVVTCCVNGLMGSFLGVFNDLLFFWHMPISPQRSSGIKADYSAKGG